MRGLYSKIKLYLGVVPDISLSIKLLNVYSACSVICLYALSSIPCVTGICESDFAGETACL